MKPLIVALTLFVSFNCLANNSKTSGATNNKHIKQANETQKNLKKPNQKETEEAYKWYRHKLGVEYKPELLC